MITEEQFNAIANRYGCGYWNVCDDHACGCSPSAAVSQGYNVKTYASMEKSFKEYCNQLNEEIDEYIKSIYDLGLEEDMIDEDYNPFEDRLEYINDEYCNEK